MPSRLYGCRLRYGSRATDLTERGVRVVGPSLVMGRAIYTARNGPKIRSTPVGKPQTGSLLADGKAAQSGGAADHGFTVACFHVKIANASAGWTLCGSD